MYGVDRVQLVWACVLQREVSTVPGGGFMEVHHSYVVRWSAVDQVYSQEAAACH